ncbi:MAG: signal recognition particle protein [Erysipelotrichaceae bacterium]|nr:signal recognition particle protein [Bacilli bacterium]NLV28961.1 signal recognition particle protein [Erysipelotrichaceae bacterium]HPY79999.1 signal recognition particle protein [Bacilli bacterium]HQA56089.1 signal recognition particle protein [Bacilli bacterium]
MAFESLTDKLTSIFKKIRGQARLTESNMDDMLKQIRIALLEADVNYKVVKEFTSSIREKAIGQQVLLKLNPGQMLVGIVHEELTQLLGSEDSEINYQTTRPTVIMMVGLQGSGKTTTTGKLAYLMKNKLRKKVLLAAGDVYRPAAIDQLEQLAKTVGVDILSRGTSVSPVKIAIEAKQKAFDEHYDVLIIDTAGRLQIDEQLMNELSDIKKEVVPDEILLLVDAMAGQDAVNVADSFNQKLGLTGVVMSKLDGDARGGAALSIKHMTGVPIKFSGVGEKLTDLDVFHPDRMADRILGMGDVLTLVEKAKEEIDEKEARKAANKMFSGSFGLDDMLSQLKQVQKLGSLGGLLKLIPGMPKISSEQQAAGEREMRNFEVIINSMTPEERQHPDILKYSRKIRIANGCGKSVADLNRMLKKYETMKETMKKMDAFRKSGKMPPGGLGGMGFPL